MPRTYTDENGYKRGDLGHSDLIHRQKAYRNIYLKNRDKYLLPFSEYQVHHIDGDKKNNKISNLQIVTREEHEEIHGIGKNQNLIDTDYDDPIYEAGISSGHINKNHSNKYYFPKKFRVSKPSNNKRISSILHKIIAVVIIVFLVLISAILILSGIVFWVENQHFGFLEGTYIVLGIVALIIGFLIEEKWLR